MPNDTYVNIYGKKIGPIGSLETFRPPIIAHGLITPDSPQVVAQKLEAIYAPEHFKTLDAPFTRSSCVILQPWGKLPGVGSTRAKSDSDTWRVTLKHTRDGTWVSSQRWGDNNHFICPWWSAFLQSLTTPVNYSHSNQAVATYRPEPLLASSGNEVSSEELDPTNPEYKLRLLASVAAKF